MKRIIRDRRLTPEEIARDKAIIEAVEKEFPPLKRVIIHVGDGKIGGVTVPHGVIVEVHDYDVGDYDDLIARHKAEDGTEYIRIFHDHDPESTA